MIDRPPPNARLLLAEDHEINQLLATEILESAGYQVDVVGDGAKAVEARFAHGYGAILMDCQMPVMDGFAAARAIRSRESEPASRVPIIALTANAIAGDRETCLAAGMDDYLSKPFTPAALLAAVEKWLIGSDAVAPEADSATGQARKPPAANAVVIGRLMDLVGGDRGKVRHYLQMFVASAPATLESLRKAVAQYDDEQIRRCSHKLKGSAAMVGAEPLAAVAATLEREAQAKNLTNASGLLSQIDQHFTAVRDFVAANGVEEGSR